jgi:hypothetical protein
MAKVEIARIDLPNNTMELFVERGIEPWTKVFLPVAHKTRTTPPLVSCLDDDFEIGVIP